MDWSGCALVERVPGKVSGQWVVKGTRILADGLIENADAGYSAEQIATEIYEGLTLPDAETILTYVMASRESHPA